jgi:ATP-dependent helicase HepA
VELLRRFNMRVSLYDEERCEALESNPDCQNPFLDDAWILADIGFLAGKPKRAMQVVQAGWDLVIVDEAHHLAWAPDAVSPEYALVEQLAAISTGLLLLTATPEETGPTSHFARLRLLDSVRYHDLATFERDVESCGRLLPLVERLAGGKKPTKADRKALEAMGFPIEATVDELVTGLLDRFGAGRVMFRNTRRHLSGFPTREATLYPLASGADTEVKWLVDLLRKLDEDKVLLICRSQAQALRLRDDLKRFCDVRTAVFHEEQSLIERDRGAAWFADPEGARLLITSSIGGEGRNFQFAHHLVLYDVPANPEVLEQRIGRLDRIGQTHTIQIHVPYQPGAEAGYR